MSTIISQTNAILNVILKLNKNEFHGQASFATPPEPQKQIVLDDVIMELNCSDTNIPGYLVEAVFNVSKNFKDHNGRIDNQQIAIIRNFFMFFDNTLSTEESISKNIVSTLNNYAEVKFADGMKALFEQELFNRLPSYTTEQINHNLEKLVKEKVIMKIIYSNIKNRIGYGFKITGN